MRDDGRTLTGRALGAMVKLLGVLVDVLRRADEALRALVALAHRVAAIRFPGSARPRHASDLLAERAQRMLGHGFPLLDRRGTGLVVGSDESGIDLLVQGVRAHFTWDRLAGTWQRLLANHTLGIDELGGGPDAVGLVSLIAHLQPDAVTVIEADGLLVLKAPPGTPVHQYADMSRPVVWSPVRHLTHGG